MLNTYFEFYFDVLFCILYTAWKLFFQFFHTKLREINVIDTKLLLDFYLKLFSRNIFHVRRMDLSFFHTLCQLLLAKAPFSIFLSIRKCTKKETFLKEIWIHNIKIQNATWLKCAFRCRWLKLMVCENFLQWNT